MTRISEAIQQASLVLKENGIPNHRKEAASLLSVALGKDQTFLIAHNEYELTATEEETFQRYLTRRASREPFQHIAGKQEFYGFDFVVSTDVLVPRPETELLVEAAIEFLSEKTDSKFCEVGVGSGCIAVSILKNVENARAVGLDISAEALKIAELNAENLSVKERLELLNSDVFSGLEKQERFDLIVSNPPYIPKDDFEDLQPEVKDFDPRIALTDEKDGLSTIERVVVECPERLKLGGLLLMEIGIGQSEDVKNFFHDDTWKSVEFIDDLQGIPRMVKAQKR